MNHALDRKDDRDDGDDENDDGGAGGGASANTTTARSCAPLSSGRENQTSIGLSGSHLLFRGSIQ